MALPQLIAEQKKKETFETRNKIAEMFNTNIVELIPQPIKQKKTVEVIADMFFY